MPTVPAQTKINSDEEGGNATIDLNWEFVEENNLVVLRETGVWSQSVEKWPWCIKTSNLVLSKDSNRFLLTGKWEGHIEGYTMKDGLCAPGNIYLEQPILNTKINNNAAGPTIDTITNQEVEDYTKSYERKVEVERVLEVQNKTVKVRVWDNGIIDGDILSLFVNGEMILDNFRVTRRKHETIVKLDKSVNYLIMHAINLGSISPNTVAVSVDDGIEEQVVIMSSNLKRSGAIMIRQFTVQD